MKIHFLYIFVVIISGIRTSMSADTLNLSQFITSNESLISALEKFQLGFFSPGKSNKFYLAIWFNMLPVQTVWIANRDNPLNDSSGIVRIGNDGNLIILDSTDSVIWSTRIQNITSRRKSSIVQLLDSGNLVLKESTEEETILWQSFDHPSHAVIPEMKIGWDFKTGLNRNLTSWKNSDDPSQGEYTHGFDLTGIPQLIIWRGSTKIFRSGPWNGVDFGLLDYQHNEFYSISFTVNSEEVNYMTRLLSNSSLMMGDMSYSSEFIINVHGSGSKEWQKLFAVPWDPCVTYAFCGPNSVCDMSNSRACICMVGYTPRDGKDWEDRIWSGGCTRKNLFNCSEIVNFKAYEYLKMPDFLEFRVNSSMSMEECEEECSKNCSCTAYASSRSSGAGLGCLLWYGDLIDVSKLPTPRATNQRLYIRATSEDLEAKSDSKKSIKIVILGAMIPPSILLLLIVLFFIWKRKSWKQGTEQCNQAIDLEIPSFDIFMMAKATENFSETNRIGEGGFGPVYKGKLASGQEVAVKRLSEDSHQGNIEFMNEVELIAKVQHRNLVRLVGYCINGDERMLIYEYMPNGSLDNYIFGGSSSTNNPLLVWSRRFDIIVGIARGLLYLQRDSRLRIIHRDLKASNVLLDKEMNPKISDFGLARAFGEDELTAKTKRVVGTYGYMAPEYAIDGIYSIKSDVFSFGVLVLEIIIGQKNNQFTHPDHNFNLLGHAWKLWLDEKGSDLIDPLMEDSFPMAVVLRCIHVGLLCVQQRPDDRPIMSSVLFMLDSEIPILQQPTRPGYFTERFPDELDYLSDGKVRTINELTHSVIEGR